MKRKREYVTLEYLKSLKWEIHKIDFNADVGNTATWNDTSSPLGRGSFWIDLEYIQENYGGDTPLIFEGKNFHHPGGIYFCEFDKSGEWILYNEDIFLEESDYIELIQHIRGQ